MTRHQPFPLPIAGLDPAILFSSGEEDARVEPGQGAFCERSDTPYCEGEKFGGGEIFTGAPGGFTRMTGFTFTGSRVDGDV